jgi:LysR family transcriptional regulator, low CO2-responsive transcriptional regulator
MHITWRQLRLFQALAQNGSVTAAAAAEHVTQPTVSMQLRQLSEAAGVPLYETLPRGVRLTDAGQRLARACEDILARWEGFEMELADLQGLKRGRLDVAVVSTAKSFIPRLLGPFSQRYPDIDVHLEVANRDSIVRRLEQSLDDLVIMTTPPDHVVVDAEPLLGNPLVLVAASTHPLAQRRRLSLAAVASERFILREPGSGTRISCERQFQAWGFSPRVQMSLGSNEAIKQAVAGGYGLAVLSRHALDRDPAHEGLTVLDVKGFPIASRWYLVRRRERQTTVVAAAFLDFLREALGKPEAVPAASSAVRPARPSPSIRPRRPPAR